MKKKKLVLKVQTVVRLTDASATNANGVSSASGSWQINSCCLCHHTL